MNKIHNINSRPVFYSQQLRTLPQQRITHSLARLVGTKLTTEKLILQSQVTYTKNSSHKTPQINSISPDNGPAREFVALIKGATASETNRSCCRDLRTHQDTFVSVFNLSYICMEPVPTFLLFFFFLTISVQSFTGLLRQ